MPTTKAGERLLDFLREIPRYNEPREQAALRRRVDAIEAEAREDEFDKGWSKGKAWGEKQERARIRAAVEGLPLPKGTADPTYIRGWDEALAAVLRIIDGKVYESANADSTVREGI